MAVSISISMVQNSQSIVDNTSNVTVKVTAKWTSGSYNATGQCTGSLTIDGTKYSFSGISFNTSQTTTGSKVIMKKTVDVSHEDDGVKTLECSASFVTGVSSGTVKASASKELTTIPRKSEITVTNGTLGKAQTFTIEKKAESFTHKLKYACGDASGWMLGNDSETSDFDSFGWMPPLTLAQQNTIGTSVSVTLTLETYTSDGTFVGSNDYTTEYAIPESVAPWITLEVTDAAGYESIYEAYIQGHSIFDVVVTPYMSNSQGATIISYKTTIAGLSYTDASFTTDVISETGTLTIVATVTDSRNRTATASVEVEVLPYAAPNIDALSVFRCDADGTASSSGEYLAVVFDATVTALNNKNTAGYAVLYKKASDADHTERELTDYANNYSVSGGVFVFAADTASSYNVILAVSDDFWHDDNSIRKAKVGASIRKTWSMLAKGLGFAFGKIAEVANCLDMGWFIKMNNNKITELATPTENQDAVNKQYVDEKETVLKTSIEKLENEELPKKVSKSGDTMTGNLDFGGFRATNLATPQEDTDAATKAYVDTKADIVKLWENASPTSNFAEQTIQLGDLSDYDFLEFHYKLGTDNEVYESMRVRIGFQYMLSFGSGYYDRVTSRQVTVEANGAITFATAYAGSKTATTASIIPIAIYGIKGVTE